MGNTSSRFIQISDAVLLEYCINKNYDGITFDDTETIKVSSENDHIVKTPSNELIYVNGNYVNNLALPINYENSDFFNSINKYDVNFATFSNAYYVATGKEVVEPIRCTTESVPYDTIKLHISTGYSFDNVYGFYLKIYVKSSDDAQKNAVLLSYTYNKSFSRYTYNMNPIFFSNRMYDKYIEIKIPSISYLSLNANCSLTKALKINKALNNINIGFNDLYEDNYTIYDLTALNSGTPKNNKVTINCGEFNIDKKSSTSIPLNAITDNFGINIAENTTGEYIEYYTTWKNAPLTPEIVAKFNTIIPLYNVSRSTYEERYKESGLTPQEMWYVLHTLNVYLNVGTDSYLLDVISNTQFFNNSNGIKFYYRPIPARINELGISVTDIDSIVINYEAKLVNAVDGTGTQILRTGSLAVDPTKYLINTNNTLAASDIFNYNIYNKIIKTNQNLESGSDIAKVKYTKVFYDTSNISLNGTTGTYVMKLGNSPKNYKFVFTQADGNGNTDYLNFSNSYYKLYSKDKNGSDLYIDATYSENMNTILGELEFYISSSMITKLKEVPESNRFLSIVVVNQDNTISTVYEFTYE